MATKTSRASKAPGYKCAECGWTTAKWVGRCGECQAWGTVEETGARRGAHDGGHYRSGAGPPDRRGGRHHRGVPAHRRGRTGPCPRRRAGPGRRHPAGRRARRGQVHAAAGRRGQVRPHRAGRPLHHRRGVRRPGQAPRGADRRRRRIPVPVRRNGPRAGPGPGGEARAAPADRGLGPDPQQRRRGGQRRRRLPGARGGRVHDRRGQAAQHDHAAGGPCDQGRLHRRAAAAGAPGGCSVPVRGRTAFAAAAAAGGQEPLRPHGRRRLL